MKYFNQTEFFKQFHISKYDIPTYLSSEYSFRLIISTVRFYRVLFRMVWMRWAMVSTVHWENSWLMVLCISSSVSKSTAAVASSRIRIFDFRSKALARHSSCLWPTLYKKIIIIQLNKKYMITNYLNVVVTVQLRSK